jgi:hypothetical protein
MAKRKSGTQGRGGNGLSGLSTEALRRELTRRGRKLPALTLKLERARAKVAAIEAEIAVLNGPGGPGGPAGSGSGRKRPRNDSNLVDALHKLLTGKQMSVTDAAEAVQEAGYKTSAANFRTIVNQTLIKFRSRFKKVSRGVYTAS